MPETIDDREPCWCCRLLRNEDDPAQMISVKTTDKAAQSTASSAIKDEQTSNMPTKCGVGCCLPMPAPTKIVNTSVAKTGVVQEDTNTQHPSRRTDSVKNIVLAPCFNCR